MRRITHLLLLLILAVSLLPASVLAAPAAADDWDVPGGHFFTQTGGGGGKGYSVTNNGDILFWSEFKRLGGVQAVGYPVSRRFRWDGFTVQVFQRVIFQWHSDSNSAAFVNVFDRLHELGKDDWLLAVRQTPKPVQMNEQGKTWNQIVAGRLALLDASPPIKAKYFSVVGDPIQANGLPTSAVTDMGNHYALRAQRVTFQLWKEDVPWAKKGEVTVALGGDIAKEAGILPDKSALEPGTPEEIAQGVVAPQAQWTTYTDNVRSFKYPSDWTSQSGEMGMRTYSAPDGHAMFLYLPPINTAGAGDRQGMMTSIVNGFVQGFASYGQATLGVRESATINGNPAEVQSVQLKSGPAVFDCVVVLIQKGQSFHAVIGMWFEPQTSTYQPTIMTMIQSYTPR